MVYFHGHSCQTPPARTIERLFIIYYFYTDFNAGDIETIFRCKMMDRVQKTKDRNRFVSPEQGHTLQLKGTSVLHRQDTEDAV